MGRKYQKGIATLLRASGYRQVYEVIDQERCVLGIAAGKRGKNEMDKQARSRKKNWVPPLPLQ